METAERPVTLDEHFFEKILVLPPDANGLVCWAWTGRIERNGRPRFWWHGKPEMAYRVALAAAMNVPLSALKGVVARHTCDHEWCVNPNHLIPGTQQQNMHDCIGRGRNYLMELVRWEKEFKRQEAHIKSIWQEV